MIGVLQKKKQNSNYSGPDNDYLYRTVFCGLARLSAADKSRADHAWISR